MRLQRWAASLQRLDAFATDGCIAVPCRGAHCAPVSYIAAPVTVITTMFREGARRVIGATAKPLYPIDGKAVGLDRRNPRPPSSREGDRRSGGRSYQTVEGVSRRWKELSDGGRMTQPSGASFTFPGCLRLSTPPPLFWWFRSFSAYMRWSARMRISAAAALSSG